MKKIKKLFLHYQAFNRWIMFVLILFIVVVLLLLLLLLFYSLTWFNYIFDDFLS